MKFDLHIHSKYSNDSFLSPEKIIKIAKKKGLNGVAITDHNTIRGRGGIEALKINDNKDFRVIAGAEINTEYGDIIGLFLGEEIKTRRFEGVLEEIRSQGRLSILAHPFRKYKNPGDIVDKLDLIEAFNARSVKEKNKKAYILSKEFEKPITAGSDAHLGFEIGGAMTIVNDDVNTALKKGETKIEGGESSYYLVHGLSVAMEDVRMIWRFCQ